MSVANSKRNKTSNLDSGVLIQDINSHEVRSVRIKRVSKFYSKKALDDMNVVEEALS